MLAGAGTGKTAAFALPALALIDGAATNKPLALILTPTRELAMQVADALQPLGHLLQQFIACWMA